MFEIIFHLTGEFVLQAVIEVSVELGFHSLKEPFKRPPNPWLAAFGYAVFGAGLGAASLLVFPDHFVPAPTWRLVNLIVSPIAAGLLMAAFGVWRARRGQAVFRIDRFSYGYLFALSLGLVRYHFAS